MLDERFGVLSSVVLSHDPNPLRVQYPPGLSRLGLAGLVLGVMGTDTKMCFMLFAVLCVLTYFVSELGVLCLLVASMKRGS